MNHNLAVFLAAILAGSTLNATELAHPAASQGSNEPGEIHHEGKPQERMSATLVVSSPRLSVTLPSVEPAAPEINLTLDNGGYDYSGGR